MLTLRGIGKSDVGNVRINNEDTIFVSNEPIGCLPNLFIVADGMGGHKAGEVASSKAVEFFCEYVKTGASINNELLDYVIEAVTYANKKVFELTVDNFDFCGMGTTFTAVVVLEEKLYIGHVGDSRVYIADNEGFRLLTTDHTYVTELVDALEITPEEAKIHPQRNMLTRALGVDDNLRIDGFVLTPGDNSTILICSDGLTNMVSDQQLCEIASSNLTLEQKLDRLIKTANDNGGIDNISVILISMGEVII